MGGSALIMTCVALGLVQSIANKKNKGKEEHSVGQTDTIENELNSTIGSREN
jgi:hypothetical protein